jgi:hypothetical protein
MFILKQIQSGIVRGGINYSILVWNFVEIISIYKLLRKDTAQSIFIKRVIVLVNVVYWVPLMTMERYILHVMPSIRILLNSIGDFIVLYVCNKLRLCLVIVLLIVIPRLVVGVSLLYDVVYLGCIDTMYKAIQLLVVPIVFNVVLGMVKHEAQSSKQEIEDNCLHITYVDKQSYVSCRDTTSAIKKYEINKKLFVKYYNILDTLAAIEIVRQSKLILYLRAFTLAIFLLAWIFYLIILMNFLYLKYYLYSYVKRETQAAWKRN